MATLDLADTTDADGFVIYFGGQAGFVVRKLLEEPAGGEGLRHARSYTPFVLRMQGDTALTLFRKDHIDGATRSAAPPPGLLAPP
jgi:hypothetical protein